MGDQAAVVVGGLGDRQQVVDVVVPGGGKTGVPVAHAEEQGLGVVAHQFQGDDRVTGALAAVAGHHEGLVVRDGRADVGQQRPQRAVVRAGDMAGVVDAQAADVDDRIGVGVGRQFGGQRIGADAADGDGAVVHDILDRSRYGREDIGCGRGDVVVIGASRDGQDCYQQQHQPISSLFHLNSPPLFPGLSPGTVPNRVNGTMD